MNSNRSASFPADDTNNDLPLHRPNNGYLYAQIQSGFLAALIGMAVYFFGTRGADLSSWLMLAAAALGAVAVAVQLVIARRQTNRSIAAYREKNPDVELTRGP